jgi:hypothetical protein
MTDSTTPTQRRYLGQRYVIHCSVSGGVTGYREAVLKKNGEVLYFTDRAEAEEEAKRLRQNMGRTSLASFRYVVEEA